MDIKSFIRNAALPILVGLTITFSVITSHNDAVGRDHAAQHAIVVSCKATNDGLTDLVSTVNDLLTGSKNQKAVNDKLTASVAKSYTQCLSGVTK